MSGGTARLDRSASSALSGFAAPATAKDLLAATFRVAAGGGAASASVDTGVRELLDVFSAWPSRDKVAAALAADAPACAEAARAIMAAAPKSPVMSAPKGRRVRARARASAPAKPVPSNPQVNVDMIAATLLDATTRGLEESTAGRVTRAAFDWTVYARGSSGGSSKVTPARAELLDEPLPAAATALDVDPVVAAAVRVQRARILAAAMATARDTSGASSSSSVVSTQYLRTEMTTATVRQALARAEAPASGGADDARLRKTSIPSALPRVPTRDDTESVRLAIAERAKERAAEATFRSAAAAAVSRGVAERAAARSALGNARGPMAPRARAIAVLFAAALIADAAGARIIAAREAVIQAIRMRRAVVMITMWFMRSRSARWRARTASARERIRRWAKQVAERRLVRKRRAAGEAVAALLLTGAQSTPHCFVLFSFRRIASAIRTITALLRAARVMRAAREATVERAWAVAEAAARVEAAMSVVAALDVRPFVPPACPRTTALLTRVGIGADFDSADVRGVSQTWKTAAQAVTRGRALEAKRVLTGGAREFAPDDPSDKSTWEAAAAAVVARAAGSSRSRSPLSRPHRPHTAPEAVTPNEVLDHATLTTDATVTDGAFALDLDTMLDTTIALSAPRAPRVPTSLRSEAVAQTDKNALRHRASSPAALIRAARASAARAGTPLDPAVLAIARWALPGTGMLARESATRALLQHATSLGRSRSRAWSRAVEVLMPKLRAARLEVMRAQLLGSIVGDKSAVDLTALVIPAKPKPAFLPLTADVARAVDAALIKRWGLVEKLY